MTDMIDRTKCPQCKEINCLSISVEFDLKPHGTWSLSGGQTKTTGKLKPFIKCKNCSFSLIGEFDGETHAVFTPPEGSS